MNKKPQLHWAINLSERDNLVFGKITHCRRTNRKKRGETDDLVAQLGDDGIHNLMMDAVLALTPNDGILLHTPGPGNQTWFRTPKKSRFKRFCEFFVRFYLDLLLFFRFVFRLRGQRFGRHIRNIERHLEREISKIYTDELKKDGIPLMKEDFAGHYCIRLNKAQLPKYLDALGNYGGVPHYDTVVVSRSQEQLLREDDIKFIADTLIFKKHSDGKENNLRIESVMNDYETIGILVEGYYYFIAHLAAKRDIVDQLNKVASKYHLTTDLNEEIL